MQGRSLRSIAGPVAASLALLAALAVSFSPPSGVAARSIPAAQPHKPRVMVALVFGQSNAANFGEERHVAGPNVFNLYKGRLYRARDPLRGANGEGGSVWTRLADRLIAEGLFDSVILVPAAIGGTEIARWTPDGELHPLILRAIEDVQRRRLKFTHLLWHQGESDAVLFTSRADYRQRFLAMLASIREHGVDAPVFVATATRCGQYPVNPDIQQAQRELVDFTLGILPGPNTDLLDETFRYDTCHFSKEGLDAHALMWLWQIKAYLPPEFLPTPTPAPTPALSPG